MKLTSLSIIAALLAQTATSAPVQRAECTTKSQRKAWHTLTTDEKHAYIEAEQCLMSLPPKFGLLGPSSRFDEFVTLHVMVAPEYHFTGSFLPYHRLMVQNHFLALRDECNYKGAQPYWNETLDAGNFKASVVLDPETGFGGDGGGEKGCVQDGPFKDYVSGVGPYANSSAHCITRKIDECQSSKAAKVHVDKCMEKQTFNDFWPCIEENPHDGLHQGMGGLMRYFGSPGDPLFYLHHTYMDKVWWQWQSAAPSSRLFDISGQNALYTLPPSFSETDICGVPPSPDDMPPLVSAEVGRIMAEGDAALETTLGHILHLPGLWDNQTTVGDVMDIQGGFLCYEYDD
ncbi:Di-copper centre-containing protein [Massarina eburnea CBS 473.64]|uniref:Di-copper centre-containing protein n=1 Tax=Massarina eburnea CBS 473.64 TaxID=1395130 RepID=A0A6A6RIC1_9PLEO|nr:Di-copper centre-containing protein [Massarina eburnea CBS 473.64]